MSEREERRIRCADAAGAPDEARGQPEGVRPALGSLTVPADGIVRAKQPTHRRRASGEGCVFQPRFTDHATGELRTSSLWWITYRDPRKPKGQQRIRESAHTESRSAAAKLLRRRLADINAGRAAGPDVEKTTFDDLSSMLQDDFVVNKRRSLKRIRGALKHLEREFSGTKALAITEDRVTAYVRKRQEEGAENGTINRELTTLKRMFRLGERALRVNRRPFIAMLKEAAPRSGFFEPSEVAALLTHLPSEVRPIVQVAYITGWRLASEILTRQWKHVDFGGGWLRLEPGETKNGEGRNFPLTSKLRAILEEQRARTTAFEQAAGRIVPWVFHREGEAIRAFRRSWAMACAEVGLGQKILDRKGRVEKVIAHRIPHDFRRTAVRNLELAGVPRSTAMAMVGHKTEAIYRRYAIVDAAALREGAAKLAVLHEAQGAIAASSKLASLKK